MLQQVWYILFNWCGSMNEIYVLIHQNNLTGYFVEKGYFVSKIVLTNSVRKNVLRRGHVSCFSFIVIMISAMFIFYFCPKLHHKHCSKHYDRKTRYKFGPLVTEEKLQGWRPNLQTFWDHTRTIYSNSERKEQFLKRNVFFYLFLEVS